MLPDRVSNPGPLTYESGALPIALRGRRIITENHENTSSCVAFSAIVLSSEKRCRTSMVSSVDFSLKKQNYLKLEYFLLFLKNLTLKDKQRHFLIILEHKYVSKHMNSSD